VVVPHADPDLKNSLKISNNIYNIVQTTQQLEVQVDPAFQRLAGSPEVKLKWHLPTGSESKHVGCGGLLDLATQAPHGTHRGQL
jgi:hypothetical protein